VPGLAVIAVPVHNNERHVAEAIRSLLAQSYPEKAIVVFDDASTDDSPAVVAGLAAEHQLTVERGERPAGLIGAWRGAAALARATHPDARYFAWGSDHDVWEPDWLAELVAALDERPEAVLAHPLVDAVDEDGHPVKRRQPRFQTVGVEDPAERLRRFARTRRAGDIVYGLMRRDALDRCGEFPSLIRPDRALLARLAVEGEFVQVERVLWHRRYRTGVVATVDRQRRTLWAGRQPASARLPWLTRHAAWFVGSLRDRPVGQRLALAGVYVTSLVAAQADQRREVAQRRWKWARKRWRARLSKARARHS
jgi:glycosyltransferase involved in cell wall biosynthesis